MCGRHAILGLDQHLEKRIAAHNAGQGAKYTRSRRPVTLRYYEEFEDKNEALRREYALKKMTRAQKCALIESGKK